ncbi:MAG: hypothetical protein Q9166_000836 [cf. Caloplaca sp. 2 TL-2023]
MTIDDERVNHENQSIRDKKIGKAPLKHPDQQMPASEHRGCESENDLFFMDSTGSQVALKTKLTPPQIPRSPSPTPSNSSNEVIVFTGRRRAQRKVTQQSQHKLDNQSLETNHHRPGTDDRLILNGDTANSSPFLAPITVDQAPSTAQPSNKQSQSLEPSVKIPESENPTMSSGRSRQGRQRQQRSARYSHSRAEEDEILADYIANMGDENLLNGISSGLARHEAPPQDPWTENAGDDAAEDAINSLLDHGPDWDSDDIRDLGDLSTSAEAYSVVDKILSKRQRPTGEQYLVVGQDQSIDDARWIPLTSLDSPNARECVRLFELARPGLGLGALSSEDSDESDVDAQLRADLQEVLDDLEDERDLMERRQARMTDEQIARLLSKQEELGLGSSELLLFDGDDDDEKEDDDLLLHDPGTSVKSRKKGSAKKQHQPSCVSGPIASFVDELEQDTHGGFDVMDHERLSLRKKPKGRRGAAMFHVSDSELEAFLQSAWEKDRSKKRIRKIEREELRAQGLLGRSGPPDLNVKYPEGISMHQIQEEVAIFMSSQNQSSLALPSMVHRDRKKVHEMANVLRLKSRSSGQGNARYPVLYKTGQTGDFDEASRFEMERLFNTKRFLPRKDVKGSGKAAVIRRGRGNTGKTVGVSYADGEVVGAAAPEIGQENRGRAMLEKMGWSKGTALGAMNNKGMLQPVTHIVKTTKAGLG